MVTLSICVTVKNRSRVDVDGHELRLFPNCVRSIVESVPRDLSCELVVADWASDDWPLEKWLYDAAFPIPVRLVPLEGYFSRGRGLNEAANSATGDVLFFTDADNLYSEAVFTSGLRHIREGSAFFPIYFAFSDPGHEEGTWLHWSLGNAMLSQETFARVGGWPEYTRWGREDDDFFAAVQQVQPIVREVVPGFFHQWHPEDILWKDRYALRSSDEIEEILEVRKAMSDLASLVRADRGLILVDEARFGVDEIEGRPAHAFLEIDGEYGGPPSDDEAAIKELVRLRAKGADIIAFAWMAFWWLDHYQAFHTYLVERFPLIRDDNRLKVFDLRSEGST
jgi:glycosyltransferase involved in cell wall biosynthesis